MRTLSLLLVATSLYAALPASDAFSSISANWTAARGAMSLHGSAGVQSNTAGGESAIFWNADSFPDDQCSSLEISPTLDTSYIGVGVRMSVNNYYAWYVKNGAAYLAKRVAGTSSNLAVAGSLFSSSAKGHTMTLCANGTTLSGYLDSTLWARVQDNSLPSGAAGVTGYNNSGGSWGVSWVGKAAPTLPAPCTYSGSDPIVEDFCNGEQRTTEGNGSPLWDVFNSQQYGCWSPPATAWYQVWSVTPGAGTSTVAPTGTASCPYIYNYTSAASGGYTYPNGYLQHYLKQGTFTTSLNRLIMVITPGVTTPNVSIGTVGTWVRPHSNSDITNQGMHYYWMFYNDYHAGEPITYVLTARPTHMVGTNFVNMPADPEWYLPTLQIGGSAPVPVHFFDGLTHLYWSQQYLLLQNATFSVNLVKFAQADHQPDEYFGTATIQHTGTKWEATWQAPVLFAGAFDVRYSTSNSCLTLGWSTCTDGGTVTTANDAFGSAKWDSSVMAKANVWVGIRPRPTIMTAANSTPIRITVPMDLNLQAGDSVNVTGNSAITNGSYTVTPIPRQYFRIGDGTLTNIVVTGGAGSAVATVPGGHTLKTGQWVRPFQVSSPGTYDDGQRWYKITGVSGTTINFTMTGAPNGTYSASSLVMDSLPALDLVGTTANGEAAGGTVNATSETSNFFELTPVSNGIVVPAPPEIATSSLPDGIVTVPYTGVLAVVGESPVTWSLTTGSLCDGLSLNQNTGALTGIPTTVQTCTFTVTASNGVPPDAVSGPLSITINAPGPAMLRVPAGVRGLKR